MGDLKRGEGAIVRRGLQKIAADRDEAGALHLNSASCTHVGCHLHWNSFEICWDCPCHGSMFDVKGFPINAPALGPLAKVGAMPRKQSRTLRRTFILNSLQAESGGSSIGSGSS
jgi:Rieske Fe-S protein